MSMSEILYSDVRGWRNKSERLRLVGETGMFCEHNFIPARDVCLICGARNHLVIQKLADLEVEEDVVEVDVRESTHATT